MRPNEPIVLPDVLIIGVRKAGTGALRHFLTLHPDLIAPNKELHFFDKDQNYEKGLAQYSRQLPKKERDSQLLLEKTPGYFFRGQAPERIAKDLPNVKLILIVREPFTRMMSGYVNFDVGNRKRAPAFEVNIFLFSTV